MPPTTTTFLVLGSGAREHALAGRLAAEAPARRVYLAPGNAGAALDPAIRVEPDLDLSDHAAAARLAARLGADLSVVGPEQPLCRGIASVFEASGVALFGPSAEAARIEGSKTFAKEVMGEAGVPTAAWRAFTDHDQARRYAREAIHPLVVKVDGLAAGKGVTLSRDREATLAAIDEAAHRGQPVLLEELLEGPEVSVMVIADGTDLVALPSSRDHKRLADDDRGPNTGGMGAIAPAPGVSDEERDRLIDLTVRPVLAALAARGTPYRGFLYAGLMLTEQGPRVLEYNARLGDPETQALMHAAGGDLGAALLAASRGELGDAAALPTSACACTVVLASPGYPGEVRGLGTAIEPRAPRDERTRYYWAGVARRDGSLVTGGGRVASATCWGERARERALNAARALAWPGAQYRTDIGAR